MNGQSNHRRLARVTTALAALGLVALGTACSGEKFAESLIERQIESETGGNVNLDLSDGGFTFESEDGSMTVDADGNMIIQTPDGSAIVNVDDAGNVQMSGSDGESVNINTDADGNMIIQTPDGSVVAGIDADGNYEAASDDGQFTASSGTDVPEEFPSDIVIPAGFTVTMSTVMGDSEQKIVSMTLMSESSVQEAVAAFATSLAAGGYTQESITTTADSAFAAHSKGDAQVVTTYSLDYDGVTTVGISVQY